MTDIKCDTCKHNRSWTDDIIVDGRIADQYEEWGCAKEDELDEHELNLVFEGYSCRLYEHDNNLDDPCYACPGSPEHCDKCNIKEE